MYYIQIRTAYGWHRYGADNYSSLLVAALKVQMHIDDATEWGLIRTRGIFRIVKVKPKSKL
jgi:hypothetical protein